MDFQTVYSCYSPRLARVEQLLRKTVEAQDTRLTESAVQLVEAGGKRIRPLFALICGQLGSGNELDVEFVACALELIHMATLVHDDVIDDALLRRGKPTVRQKYGDLAAMYTGDFLFARAIQLLSEIPDIHVHHEISKAMVRMCEGEIEQIRDFYNWNQSFRTYLRRIERKTALLISVSCSLPAMVSHVGEAYVRALRKFGYFTGMAFQIIDDVLDFTSTADVVGKPVGNDLRQGNITLPALLTANMDDYGSHMQILIQSQADSTSAEKAVKMVQESGALIESRKIALKYLEKARQQLDCLPEGQIRDELVIVAEYLNQRLF